MNLSINRESTDLRSSQDKRYGNLIINTTFREDKGIIDLKEPVASSSQSVTDTAIKKIKNMSLRDTINTNDSIRVMRGQKFSISSQVQDLSKLILALDWDINTIGNKGLELDTSLFMVDLKGKTAEEDFVFYGNPRSRDGALVINGDYDSGIKAAYDESIELNLNAVKMSIEKLAITATIFEGEKRNQSFSQISNAYIRIIDAQRKKELFNYRFDEGLKFETAVVVAEIYRYKNEWKINPIGNGFTGGLEALCNNYGIETE